MNYFLMLLGLLIFVEGLFFEIQSLKPDKGFRYIAFQEGYNIELGKPDPNSRLTDKDGKDITAETSFLLFRKVEPPLSNEKEK